ncbi:hypothetical protein N665_0383s0042 [Sinapis alba]|nr:hypothetical protein N665_0383s0042 [Sinapis alba]
MDKQSATPAEAYSNVIKDTTHQKGEPKDDLEKHKKDITEKKIPDVIETLKRLVDRLEKMEEKVDYRLQKMEGKVDMLISSVRLNSEVSASMKIGSVKAEVDNMSVDDSSSDDEGPVCFRTPKKATTSNRPFGPSVRGRLPPLGIKFGRFGEESSQTEFGKQENDSSFNRFSGYGPTSLNVGGRFAGGRCGGLGQCSFC